MYVINTAVKLVNGFFTIVIYGCNLFTAMDSSSHHLKLGLKIMI
jgi:hypothetical protein